MSKELPYFRFTASEWLSDDISLESYETKGIFADVCAYYWFKDCSITKALLEKRFNNCQGTLKHLFELGIIKSNNGSEYIEILFLNKQFDLLSESRKRRQDAGSKGGKKKRSNAKAMLKQCGSYKDKDNNKEKDKKKDNIVSAKKAEMDFIDQIIQLFVEAHGDYLIVNNGEERKAAAKILGIYKKKYPAATSEETLQALKQYFLSCVNIPDAWLKTNMSLPIIINKFNQISKILKNGTAKKPGATYTDLARITLKNFPEQFNKD